MFIVALRNLICIFGLIFISPILIIVAIAIFFEDGFPIFFSQRRIGKNLNIFKIYKIRTMKLETPESGTHNINKKFILKTGFFARKLKLDEFPQLINVIKGELNLIGPRPGLENQLELKECRMKRNIFETTPGITGLAQVTGYDMSDPEKLSRIDKYYIENQSLKINFQIFLATFFKSMRPNLVKKVYEI